MRPRDSQAGAGAGTSARLIRKASVGALAGALALAAAAPAYAAGTYGFERSFGSQGTGPGQFSQPQGLAVDPSDGELFVADTNNHRIQVFTPAGTFSRQFGSLGSGNGQMTSPKAVGVSPVAPFDAYVADTNNNRIERFTNDGVFVSSFGTNGGGAGQVQFPRAIAFDPAGNVYVGDNGFNNRISVWTANGTFQSNLGGFATFQRLAGLTNSSGTGAVLWATDALANGAKRIAFNGLSGGDMQSGVLNGPAGVAVDSENDGAQVFAFVADAGNHRVAVFGGGGPLISTFGFCCTAQGAGEGSFQDPSGIAYSPFNKRIYVAEGNNCCTKISVWQEIPRPVLGKTMDIKVDKGTVLYKPPGSKKFKKLNKVTLVKSGTIIDTRRGTVSITSVTAKGTLQSADFFKGIFKAVQKRQGKGLTTAELVGSLKRCARSARSAKKQPRPVRQLWADGTGQFRTKGRYLSASIRGTAWQTSDSCSGSLVKVTQGSVLVTDFLNKKNAVVQAGGFYSVTAPHAG